MSPKQRASSADPSGDMWMRHIQVSDHARQRAKERLGWDGTVGEVRSDVRDGLVADRVSSVKPNWAHGGDNDKEPTRGLYVWDAAGTRCWVIVKHGGVRISVLTLLIDHVAYTELAAGAYVRRGMRRA